MYIHACTCKKLDQWLNQVTKLFFWRSPNEGTKLGALQFCPNLKAGIAIPKFLWDHLPAEKRCQGFDPYTGGSKIWEPTRTVYLNFPVV